MTQGPNVLPAPADAHTDGLSRMVRSWVGGSVATGLAYGGAGLLSEIGTISWTGTYWKALGLQVTGVALYGVVAYAMRRFAPPQV